MKTAITIIGLGLACAVLLVAWRLANPKEVARAGHSAILRDRSLSSGTGCNCISTLGERVLNSPNTKAGTKVSFFLTGDKDTANEPILKQEYTVPDNKRVLEGRGPVLQFKQDLIKDLNALCTTARPTSVSPIYYDLKRVVEHLKKQGCVVGSDCYLYVQTDGEELDDPEISRALNGTARTKVRLPPPIQNEGITVVFCGLAETIGIVTSQSARAQTYSRKHSHQHSDNLKKVWKELFTDQTKVLFEPYCAAEGE